jgi:hypothetical protein
MRLSFVRPINIARRTIAMLIAGASVIVMPAQATAQVFIRAPDYSGARVTGSEPGIVLPLPGATAEEYSAALLWTLRAGLNVAALQCQALPLVNAVDNYNALLLNHGAEIRPAYLKLQDYFKRTQGPVAGMKAFDAFNTRTYNGFSSLYALAGFCHAAASIGRDVMFAPRGGLLSVAQNRMQEFRNSLVPATDRFWIARPLYLAPQRVADFPDNCYDRKHELKKRCLKD